MSSNDVRYPAATGGGSASPPVITPTYASSLPTPPGESGSSDRRCATGFRFLTTVHGILNIIIIITIVCVIISAGVAQVDNLKQADNGGYYSKAKVSAYHTRNAVLAFAIIGLILMLFDTIVHVTGLIKRFPPKFDLIFCIIMLVLAGIYLILGCCAAAWDKKMRDTVGEDERFGYQRKGCAASAAFWVFLSMILIIVDYVLRLVKKPSQSYNP